MIEWRDYQEQSALLLRGLGMDARTDVTLEGARGSHDIDVVATWTKAGLEQLWLVECKAWSRPVPRGRVIEFHGIVADVGADRGIFLAERGYQRGAFEAATRTNVLLTTLADLRVIAEADLQVLWLDEIDRRLSDAQRKLSALMVVERYVGGSTSRTPFGFDLGAWPHGLMALYAELGVASDAVRDARIGNFPVAFGWDFSTDRLLKVKDMTSALPRLDEVTLGVEIAIETADQSVRRSAT